MFILYQKSFIYANRNVNHIFISYLCNKYVTYFILFNCNTITLCYAIEVFYILLISICILIMPIP